MYALHTQTTFSGFIETKGFKLHRFIEFQHVKCFEFPQNDVPNRWNQASPLHYSKSRCQKFWLILAYWLKLEPNQTFPSSPEKIAVQLVTWPTTFIKRPPKNKATASLTTPSKTHLFLHSCRLDLWKFPRFWTSGLKPLYSFFTLFARRGNINQFFVGICMVLWSQFFFQEVFRAKAPSRVHRLTPLLCFHMKLFTCCKTCLHIRLSFKSLVRIWVGTNFFSNFQKPSSFWVPVKSRWDATLLVNCILLCETELNFNLCTLAWLLHARLPSACTRVWALFTTVWKKPVCCTSCTLPVGGREPGASI